MVYRFLIMSPLYAHADEPIELLEESADVLVVSKPCSIPVHPCGRYMFNSVTSILARERGIRSLKLVHRIDRCVQFGHFFLYFLLVSLRHIHVLDLFTCCDLLM